MTVAEAKMKSDIRGTRLKKKKEVVKGDKSCLSVCDELFVKDFRKSHEKSLLVLYTSWHTLHICTDLCNQVYLNSFKIAAFQIRCSGQNTCSGTSNQ